MTEEMFPTGGNAKEPNSKEWASEKVVRDAEQAALEPQRAALTALYISLLHDLLTPPASACWNA